MLAHVLVTIYSLLAPGVYAVEYRIRFPVPDIAACKAWIADEAKVVIEYSGDGKRAGFACVDEPTSKHVEPKRPPETPV